MTEPTGLTREAVLRMNAAAGTWVETYEPGEVVVDLDGTPLSVGASTWTPCMFGGVAVTAAQLADLGLTPEEVPNVHVLG